MKDRDPFSRLATIETSTGVRIDGGDVQRWKRTTVRFLVNRAPWWRCRLRTYRFSITEKGDIDPDEI